MDWGTAEVQDGRLTVALSEGPPKDWIEGLEAVIARLARDGAGWVTIELGEKKLYVDAVEVGAEAAVRHLLDRPSCGRTPTGRATPRPGGASAPRR